MHPLFLTSLRTLTPLISSPFDARSLLPVDDPNSLPLILYTVPPELTGNR